MYLIEKDGTFTTMEGPHDRLKRARKDAGFRTATAFARSIGVPPPTYMGHENGTTPLKRDVAIRYAKRLGVTLDWLLTNVGEGRGTRRRVPINLRVGAAAEIYPIDDYAEGAGEMVEPPPGESNCVGAVIEGDSMLPLQNGWLVFWRKDAEGVAEELAGSLCVVQVKDGPLLLKVLRLGRKKNRWNLESWNASPRDDVLLEWASRVIDIRPR